MSLYVRNLVFAAVSHDGTVKYIDVDVLRTEDQVQLLAGVEEEVALKFDVDWALDRFNPMTLRRDHQIFEQPGRDLIPYWPQCGGDYTEYDEVPNERIPESLARCCPIPEGNQVVKTNPESPIRVSIRQQQKAVTDG